MSLPRLLESLHNCLTLLLGSPLVSCQLSLVAIQLQMLCNWPPFTMALNRVFSVILLTIRVPDVSWSPLVYIVCNVRFHWNDGNYDLKESTVVFFHIRTDILYQTFMKNWYQNTLSWSKIVLYYGSFTNNSCEPDPGSLSSESPLRKPMYICNYGWQLKQRRLNNDDLSRSSYIPW